MPDTHAPLLQYADAPARHGIVFETTPEGVTVTIPVPLARRVLGMAAYGGMLVMALIIHVFVAVAMVVAGLALVAFRNRLGRPIVIELDAASCASATWRPEKRSPIGRARVSTCTT